jgi:hypothetical protein
MIPLEASAATARAALKEMQLVLVDYTATAAALELRHRASCWPPVYAPPAQRDKGIVDMSYWRDLEQHARLQLGIPPAIGAIHVKIYLESTFCGLAGDETALVAAVGQLCRLGAERLRAAPYIVGHVLSVLVPPRVLPPLNVRAPPMSHEQRNELARELLHACYAAGRQKWTSECDARVSSCPGIWRLVRRFHAKRHPPSPCIAQALVGAARHRECGNARRIVAIGNGARQVIQREWYVRA